MVIPRYCRGTGNPRAAGEGWDSLLGGGRILQQEAVELRSPPTLLLRGFRVPEAEAARGSRAGPGGGSLSTAARWPPRARPGASGTELIFRRLCLVPERQARPRSALRGESGCSARLNSGGERLFDLTIKSRLAFSPSF